MDSVLIGMMCFGGKIGGLNIAEFYCSCIIVYSCKPCFAVRWDVWSELEIAGCSGLWKWRNVFLKVKRKMMTLNKNIKEDICTLKVKRNMLTLNKNIKA